MGFDSESAGQPIVNVHKRTTKVNFAVAIAVAIFFLLAIAYVLRVAHKDAEGDAIKPPAAEKK
jgi:hypothetical protein